MSADARRYTEEHEWLSADGEQDGKSVFRLGITEFAQDELGDVVFVELPEVGADFGTGDEIGTIESVKAVAELYTPVAGTIVAVNEKVSDTPELLNEDPLGEGWLVRVAVEDAAAVDALMDADAYEKLLAG